MISLKLSNYDAIEVNLKYDDSTNKMKYIVGCPIEYYNFHKEKFLEELLKIFSEFYNNDFDCDATWYDQERGIMNFRII